MCLMRVVSTVQPPKLMRGVCLVMPSTVRLAPLPYAEMQSHGEGDASGAADAKTRINAVALGYGGSSTALARFDAKRRSRRCGFSVSHSQTVMTRHPCFRSSRLTRRSRIILSANFLCQNSRFAVGVVQDLQPLCLCQKQPCTNITVWRRRSTTSGRPGSFGPCRR